MTLTAVIGLVTCAEVSAVPPVINSITPNSVIQNPIPQSQFTITGSNLVVGFPTSTNRPTVTFAHEGGKTEFGGICNVNIAGTTITIPGTDNNFNLLQAPLGLYDVVVTRPDGQSATLADGFTINAEPVRTGTYIKQVATWGGPVRDVDVIGDLAYITNGKVMRILNIADPANPSEVGSIDLLAVHSVRVRDGYAFVTAESPYGFCVVDVHDPAQPRLVWRRELSGNLQEVRIHGNVAYVQVDQNIKGFNISDPSNVVLLPTNIGNATQRVGKFTIAGDRLYVGCDVSTGTTPQLQIYDLAADPVNPPLMGTIAVNLGEGSSDTRGIAVEGNNATWTVQYWNDGHIEHFIVDVSNPTAPAIVGSYDGVDIFADVAFSGGHIYVADRADNTVFSVGKGMAVFDASNPASPAFVTNYKPHGSVMGLRIIGNRAYLRDEGEGLIIIDISNPANPVRLGRYHSPSTLRKSVKVGDLLYVADAWNGFTVLNVADTVHPTVVGVYLAEHHNNLGVDAFGIAYQDNKVYLSAGHLGLEVIDVTNPAAPAFLGAYRIPIDAECALYWGIALSGNTAHVGYKKGPQGCGIGTPSYYFLNLDVSNAASIALAGNLLLGFGDNSLRTIAANSSGVAFCSLVRESKITVNTADAFNPILMLADDVNPVCDLALDGDVLFVANNADWNGATGEGLHIQDVSDPANPSQLAYVNAGTRQVYAVAVQNDRAYVSAKNVEGNQGGESVCVFDVRNPSSPVLLAHSPLAIALQIGDFESNGLVVDEPYVYRAFGSVFHDAFPLRSEGLAIYKVENLPAPRMPGDITDDGVVNIDDLVFLITHWGPCSPRPECEADINHDNTVNIDDLVFLITHWG